MGFKERGRTNRRKKKNGKNQGVDKRDVDVKSNGKGTVCERVNE